VQVAGKSEPVRIYQVIGAQDQVTEQQHETLRLFADALASYRAQRWAQATEMFARLQQTLPAEQRAESLYSVYLERIILLQERQLPADWDAVFIFDRK
jgi:adenylate cyclase